MMYLGDFAAAAVVDFMWSSNNASGASITRATNGTISVYKGNSTTQSTAGVTDTEDFDGLTGVHHCRIATTDAFYATGNNYMVVLSGATIDGQTVNTVLAHFSIENRYNPTPPTAAAVADAVWDEARSGHTTAGSFGQGVVVNNMATAAIDTDAFATGAITSGVIAIGALHWQAFGTGAITAATIDPGAFTAEKFATDAVNKIADGVWDEIKTGHVGAGSFGEEVQSLATPAEVKTQVVAALTSDTYAELGAVPGATSSIKDKLTWLFMLARNKHVTTAVQDRLRNDGDSADVGAAGLVDDGTAFTRGKYS